MAKNQDKKKKGGLSTAAKVGAGVATGAGVGYLAYRAMKKGGLKRLPGPSAGAPRLGDRPSFVMGSGSSPSSPKPMKMPFNTPNKVDAVYGRPRRSGPVSGHSGPVLALPDKAPAVKGKRGKKNLSANQALASMVEYADAAVEFADKPTKKYPSYFNDKVKYSSKNDRDRGDRQADKNGRAGVRGGAIIGGVAGAGAGAYVGANAGKIGKTLKGGIEGGKAAVKSASSSVFDKSRGLRRAADSASALPARAAGGIARKASKAGSSIKAAASSGISKAKAGVKSAMAKAGKALGKKGLSSKELVTSLSSYADMAVQFASDDDEDQNPKKKVAR